MQTIDSDFQTADGFQNRALKSSVEAHDFARCFHLRAERRVGINKFIERPTRELHNDIIYARFEASFGCLGDGVDNFVKRVADCNLDADFRNRIARRLRRKRGTSTDAGIDFDNVIIVALRVKRKLNVAAALNFKCADDFQACRTQKLILVVVERLSRGNND